MYEPAYKKLMNIAARRVSGLTEGRMRFEEHILLPYFGANIILRFGLEDETISKDELDALESRLYSLVPKGFLCDFMGDVYRRAGYDTGGLAEKLLKCAERYKDEPIPVSPFAADVGAETRRLLAVCGLDEDAPVWEIQPGDETELILLGERNESVGTVERDGLRVEIMTAERTACEGLMRAAAYAKRNRISLMRAVERTVNE